MAEKLLIDGLVEGRFDPFNDYKRVKFAGMKRWQYVNIRQGRMATAREMKALDRARRIFRYRLRRDANIEARYAEAIAYPVRTWPVALPPKMLAYYERALAEYSENWWRRHPDATARRFTRALQALRLNASRRANKAWRAGRGLAIARYRHLMKFREDVMRGRKTLVADRGRARGPNYERYQAKRQRGRRPAPPPPPAAAVRWEPKIVREC